MQVCNLLAQVGIIVDRLYFLSFIPSSLNSIHSFIHSFIFVMY
jgi:hypothetical protein